MTTSRFVVDGGDKLIAILWPQVREDVDAEFAARFAEASWFERWRLRWEMRREVERRVRNLVSNQTLF